MVVHALVQFGARISEEPPNIFRIARHPAGWRDSPPTFELRQ